MMAFQVCHELMHLQFSELHQDFSVIEILREINFKELKSSKDAVFAIWGL